MFVIFTFCMHRDILIEGQPVYPATERYKTLEPLPKDHTSGLLDYPFDRYLSYLLLTYWDYNWFPEKIHGVVIALCVLGFR